MNWKHIVWPLFLTLSMGCGEKKAAETAAGPMRIDVEKVQAVDVAERVLASGVIETSRSQDLYFGSGGMVTRVMAKEGQKVGAGALLAELDSESQQNNVAKSELNLEAARLNEEQAYHKLEQTRALLESGGASPENVYDKEQRLLEAQNQTRQAKLNLEGSRLHMADMQLRAPFAGVVNEVNLQVGDLVHGDVADPDRAHNMRPPMVMVQPGSGMSIKVQLPEGRATGIKVGTPAEVTLMERRDVVLKGEVAWVSGTVDRETRSVHVSIKLELPTGPAADFIRDGSAALVALLVEQHNGAPTISESAIYYSRDQAFAFVVGQDGAVRQVALTKGLTQEGRVEIRSGLTLTDRVARSHLYLLRDGQKVEIRSDETASAAKP